MPVASQRSTDIAAVLLTASILLCCGGGGCLPPLTVEPGGFELDPCVVEDLGDVDAWLEAEFGWWAPEAGLAQWCDLPPRDVFVPLDASADMSWRLCHDDVTRGATSCEAVGQDDVSPIMADVAWTCRDGTEAVVGRSVSWDCRASGHSGDRDWSVTGEWSVDERWYEMAGTLRG